MCFMNEELTVGVVYRIMCGMTCTATLEMYPLEAAVVTNSMINGMSETGGRDMSAYCNAEKEGDSSNDFAGGMRENQPMNKLTLSCEGRVVVRSVAKAARS